MESSSSLLFFISSASSAVKLTNGSSSLYSLLKYSYLPLGDVNDDLPGLLANSFSELSSNRFLISSFNNLNVPQQKDIYSISRFNPNVSSFGFSAWAKAKLTPPFQTNKIPLFLASSKS